MFWHCESLGEVEIPYGITTIGKEAFSCSYITKITIPNSVTSIGDSAFNYCNFASVSIPTNSSLTVIEKATFYNCYNLVSVTIPSNIRKVYCTAFYAFIPASQKLTSITFQTPSGWVDSQTGSGYNTSNTSANVTKLSQYNVDYYLYR